MILEILKKIVQEKRKANIPDFVIINSLKEFLQFPVLRFIYSQDSYKNFIFTGGSCLRICYNLPRLSEDLDFDLSLEDYQKLNLEKIAKELQRYFQENFLIKINFRCQGKSRIYLKFPILEKLKLRYGQSSDFLYVKVESNQTQFKSYQIELNPISNFGFNLISRNYNLSFLMTGKVLAILNREWFQGEKNEINVKGRDFYDLFWYFQNNISPDYASLKSLSNISNEKELKLELWEKISKEISPQKLSHDLKNFFSDQGFIFDFCKNYQEIMKKFLITSKSSKHEDNLYS